MSGGYDSMSAAHFLMTRGFNLFVLHVNERYISSDDVAAARVKQFCDDFGLRHQILTPEKREKDKGVEASSRATRYKAIKDYCAGADNPQLKYIATAHNLGDCAEGYIMRCLNGTPEYCPVPPVCIYAEFTLFRPFLQTEKRAFSEYAALNNLEKYITHDPLNDDLKLRRAFIRHKVLPVIKESYSGLNTVVRKIMRRHMDEKLRF